MKIKVFFNNSCNICKMEIDHYKKNSDENLEWVDITNNQEAINLTSKSQAELLRRLHVIDNGEVIGGAKAFVIIWSKIPKYKFLAKIFSFKPLFIIFHYIYEFVAYFLFLKNKHQLNEETNLSTKICPVCQRPFKWRKKWRLNWDKVKYCSKRCSSK